MSRVKQFQETINLLNAVISENQARYCTAESFKSAFEYCLDLEKGKVKDVGLLKRLCKGIPAREIEVYDSEIVKSIYKSYAEIKKMLQERLKND